MSQLCDINQLCLNGATPNCLEDLEVAVCTHFFPSATTPRVAPTGSNGPAVDQQDSPKHRERNRESNKARTRVWHPGWGNRHLKYCHCCNIHANPRLTTLNQRKDCKEKDLLPGSPGRLHQPKQAGCMQESGFSGLCRISEKMTSHIGLTCKTVGP